jgi:hypothetical protein
MPTFQNWAVSEIAIYLSKLTKHEVKVGYIRIGWFDELLLENVSIFDRQKNEMIKVGSLRADFDLVELLSNAEPVITEVWLDTPNVANIVLKDSGRLNINELIDAFSYLSSSTDTTSSAHSVFHIDKVHISNGTYSYFDQTEDLIPDQFDYYHFTLNKIYGEVDMLRIAGDTFEINVNNLKCIDKQTQLKVHELDVFYRLSASSMEFQKLNAHIGDSYVKDYLEFKYDSLSDLIDFNEKVTLNAHLDSSIFNSNDLALFAPAIKEYNETYTIWTDLSGEVVDLSFKNLTLYFGQNSMLKGRIAFKGFPNLEETFVDSRFQTLRSNSKDLEKYVGSYAKSVISKFGKINYKGTYIGFFHDFVAKGEFETGLGNLKSDINIKIKEDEKHSQYEGKISTTQFMLGKLMNQEDNIGSIAMDGRIKGSGFSYTNAKFDLNANIQKIGVNQYDYRNLKVEANLAKGAFQGKIISADSNARFTLDGLLDFSQKPYFMDFNADFTHVNLKKLNILGDPISFSTKADLSIHGNTIEDFEGDASFSNTFLSNSKKTIQLDTIKFITERIDNERYVNVFSELFEINADGSFSYATLASNLPRLYKEYMMAIENNEKIITEYYEKAKPYEGEDYKLNFSFLLKKTNPIISLFTQDFKLTDNTKLNGTFTRIANKASFNLVGYCSEFQYTTSKFSGISLNYSSTKSLYQPFVNGSGIIASKRQLFGEDFRTDGINFQFTWNNDKILYDALIDQKRNDNHLKLAGDLFLKEGQFDFLFKKIDLQLLKTSWLSDSCRITISDKSVDVKHFVLQSANQKFSATGRLSNDIEDDLHLSLQDFELKPFGAVFAQNLDGIINGDFVFSNILSKNYKLEFNGGVNNFKYDNFLIGNLLGDMDWQSEKQIFDVNFLLKRDSIPNLEIIGIVKPAENNKLELKAKLDKFNLQSFEPFVIDNFSNIWGACSGNLDITGTLLRPTVTGKVHVDKGSFVFNYLNAKYNFTDDVLFDSSAIRFSKVSLLDTLGNSCVVEGAILHERFKNIRLDLNAKFKNLLVLNTSENDNSLFYGTTFASGYFNVKGPLEEINVYVNAKNEKNSELFIPVNTAESLGGNEFVTFVKKVKPKDSVEVIVVETDQKPTEIKIKMDLDLNPDMEFSLILDKQTGDIIKGNGTGNLKMDATTGGDFNLFGTYTFKKGYYNFTLLNLVNKRFDINNGSTISWNGDPLHGNLDIKAEIIEKASLRDILPETDTAWFNNQALRKRYPAVVTLFLKGDLLQPEISYKINIKDYPLSVNGPQGTYPLDTYVRSFLQQLDANEQQLSRQVFSLLVFRKFFPLNTATSSGLAGQGAAGTVSNLLSNQLSSWISQVDEDFTVDIDLNGFNAQSLNDLRVRLSYQPELFNKRIRITRDGSFTNAQNKSTTSSIAGDWSLEYLITQDGRLRLKVFTKNNYNNVVTTLNSGNQMTTGFSFMHTQSFDNLADLIKRKKKEESVFEDEAVPNTDQNGNVPYDSTKKVKTDFILNNKEDEE